MRKLVVFLLAALMAAPLSAMAADAPNAQDLQKEIQNLSQQLQEMDARVSKNELHTALDRLDITGDFRTKADSLHAKVIYPTYGTYNPFAAMGAGVGSNIPGLTTGMASGNYNNDLMWTTRMRLDMKANVYDNVKFMGRLTMYKQWASSTDAKVFDSWSSYTMDGSDGGNTTGDWLRVERAFFSWYNIAGSNWYLSIGRRPSTYGPPTQFRENEPRGGTPPGQLVHFNFDGISIGYKLSALTGIDGQELHICYGQGFESQFGTGSYWNPEHSLKDTQLGGVTADLMNDGVNYLQATAFAALNVTNGFSGQLAVPSTMLNSIGANDIMAGMQQNILSGDLTGATGPGSALITAGQTFQTLASNLGSNGMTLYSRLDPTKNIGNIVIGGVDFVRQEFNGVNWFVSGGWSRADSNGQAGYFGGLLNGATFDSAGNVVATDSKSRNGYSIYAGVQVPAPYGKVGFEYNWGSKYWTPFVQAEDDLIGPKLGTRGQVFDLYYMFDINPHMFIKLDGMYYDYAYTNSNSPVGPALKISDVKNMNAQQLMANGVLMAMPVIDTAWDANASLTVKF